MSGNSKSEKWGKIKILDELDSGKFDDRKMKEKKRKEK